MLADDGLVLEVDRFDPGKVSSQDNQMLLPTATLPGDYVISLTVVSVRHCVCNSCYSYDPLIYCYTVS